MLSEIHECSKEGYDGSKNNKDGSTYKHLTCSVDSA